MKKLTWFTHTNIATKDYGRLDFDLTPYLEIFKANAIWNKKRYRTEYAIEFTETDFERIKTFRLHIHSSSEPLSQFHGYEEVLSAYLAFDRIERSKLFSSGITEARRIAVIEIEFESDHGMIPMISYEQEMDIEVVMGQLEHVMAWEELMRKKSIITEIVQFFIFNLHLNFLTQNYTFSITDKPELTGCTFVTDNTSVYYEADRIELLSHYTLYEKEKDQLPELMAHTAKFWCRDITSIHFFLDALKGNALTSTHFIKLVFTIESFFSDRTSNDYMTLVIPLLVSKTQEEMQTKRQLLKKCFSIRNEIVHGGTIYNFREQVKGKVQGKTNSVANYFYELKNLIIEVFYWYINNRAFEAENYRLDHEKIFSMFPKGIR